MVSTISPVVYRNSDLGHKGWLTAATFYTLGSVVGGVLAGVFFALLSALLSPAMKMHQKFFPILIGFLAIAYAMHEMQLVALPHPQRKRQVPANWRYKFHPYVTAGLFGLLLGTGFTTFIPMATYYILSLAVTLYGSPVAGVLIFAIYGAARGLLLWPSSCQNRVPGRIERLIYYMDLTTPIVRQVNGFVLAAAGAYLLGAYL
jgi:hypothetical protein